MCFAGSLFSVRTCVFSGSISDRKRNCFLSLIGWPTCLVITLCTVRYAQPGLGTRSFSLSNSDGQQPTAMYPQCTGSLLMSEAKYILIISSGSVRPAWPWDPFHPLVISSMHRISFDVGSSIGQSPHNSASSGSVRPAWPWDPFHSLVKSWMHRISFDVGS